MMGDRKDEEKVGVEQPQPLSDTGYGSPIYIEDAAKLKPARMLDDTGYGSAVYVEDAAKLKPARMLNDTGYGESRPNK